MTSTDNANEVIEGQLDARARVLERVLSADVLAFNGGLDFGADDEIRSVIESRKPQHPNLAVVLQTFGGYAEVVQRVAEVFRHNYKGEVSFIVPNHALSAGTILVLSGDRIYMDYYSILGPIDPQLPRPGMETYVPALGYLVQYNRLIEKSKTPEGLSAAELAVLIEKFDPGDLYSFEQQRELSISLIKEWLPKYKFKDWHETETWKKKVTPAMREKRAEEIANILNDPERWHSHGRGIPMRVLECDDIKLRIEDFSKDLKLDAGIKAYYRLLMDYWSKTGHMGIVHTIGEFRHLHR